MRALPVIYAAFCAGILVGLSFVATPAKFLAANVELADLLAVGRATFQVSMILQLALFLPLIALSAWRRFAATGLIALLAVQYFVLLPPLDNATLLRMQGEATSSGWLHSTWALIDGFKVVMLLAIAWSERPARKNLHERDKHCRAEP